MAGSRMVFTLNRNIASSITSSVTKCPPNNRSDAKDSLVPLCYNVEGVIQTRLKHISVPFFLYFALRSFRLDLNQL